jgi:hypothetical protein
MKTKPKVYMENDSLLHEVASYVYVGLWAVLGGVAAYINKIKRGKYRFSFSEFVGEIVISAFVGVTTFLFMQSWGIDPHLQAALVGISGHMGSRAIFLAEKIIESRVKKIIDETL